MAIIENILFAALRNVDPNSHQPIRARYLKDWRMRDQGWWQLEGRCLTHGHTSLIIQTKQAQLISTPVIFIALTPGQSYKQQEMSSRDKLKISPETGP